MKILKTLILFTLPFLSFGQNSSVDIVGSLDFNYRYLRVSESNNAAETAKSVRDKLEKLDIRWRAGFNYNIRLLEKLVLKSGLRIAQLGYKNEERQLRFGSGVTSDFKDYYNYWMIELPIMIRYELTKEKLAFFLEGGIGANYLLQAQYVYVIEGEKKKEKRDFMDEENDFQLSAIFSIGANYSVSRRLQLFAQPTFRYHLTPLYDVALKENLWSAGLEVGLRKFLK